MKTWVPVPIPSSTNPASHLDQHNIALLEAGLDELDRLDDAANTSAHDQKLCMTSRLERQGSFVKRSMVGKDIVD